MKYLTLDPSHKLPPTRDDKEFPDAVPPAKEIKVHPASTGETENASIFFVGTATTIIEWNGIRILTDPNFLHAGDHVHLGPGVTSTRRTNPAIDLHELPHIDAILLSHYHADHFDQKVEASLRRDIPIITTPHAKNHLANKGAGEAFTRVYALDSFDSMLLDIGKQGEAGVGGGRSVGSSGRKPGIKVTGMPGKHVPSGPLSVANDLLGAVPPTNGWMVELGHFHSFKSDSKSPMPGSTGPDHVEGPAASFDCGYRIYISGDTLLVDELKEIPKRYKGRGIDLMLAHLGGTTIPSPSLPLLMVTMDAEQGVKLMQLVNPDITIPVHYDDYEAFLSPLDDFKKAVHAAGLDRKVVYLDRKDQYRFEVKESKGEAAQ